LASGQVVLKRRDTGTKEIVPQSDLKARIETTLAAQQTALYAAAKERLKQNCVTADSLSQVEEILRDVTAEKGGGKFVFAHIKDDPKCDASLKEFKATVRCIPFVDEHDGPGTCIVTGERVDRRAVIAKAY
jgi:prolyl-tRNA synthetase